MRSPFSKPRLGEMLDPTHPINRNLVGSWIFNEGMGSLLGDSTWNRNSAAAVNGPLWTPLSIGVGDPTITNYSPPEWGPTLTLNGTNQSLTIPHKPYYDTSGPFSIEVVFRGVPSATLGSVLFARSDFAPATGFGATGYWSLSRSGDLTFFNLGSFPRQIAFQDSPNTVPVGDFHHYVGTWDGAFMHLYVDSQEVVGSPVAVSSYSDVSTAGFGVGTALPHSGGHLPGEIALIRLWVGRALALPDAMQLYQEPFAGWMPSTASRRWYSFAHPSATVQAQARIRATVSRSVQARANISGRMTQTVQVKANLTPRQQKATTPKANIRTPLSPTDPSGTYTVAAWTITDELSSVSPTFSVRFKGVPTLAVAGNLSIAAGYDNNNVTLISGVADDVTVATSPDAVETTITGRAAGARELMGTVVTFTVPSSPPAYVVNKARQVVKFAGGAAGLSVQNVDFPDYLLFAPYVAIGRTVLEVAAELAQPFNQFASRQFHTRIGRDGLGVYGVDYGDPPAGVTIPRSLIYRMQRRQRAYLEPPILKNIEVLIVRGASWTVPKTNLGTVTKNEYFRTVSMGEVGGGVGGQTPAPGDTIEADANSGALQEVVTEISSSQTLYGDKLLSSDEQVVIDGTLTAQTLERYWYIEPGTVQTGGGAAQLDAPTLTSQSTNPSADALLFMTSILRFGLKDTGDGPVFQETEQSVRQCFYDQRGNLACEATTTAEFDTTLLEWKITEMNVRTHAEMTSGATRTQLLNLQVTGSLFEFNTADTQVVAGGRPNTTQRNSRRAVTTVQAQSPFADLDADGHPIDVGAGQVTWTYESPYLDQHTCDFLISYATAEIPRQLLDWDEIEIECPLLPTVWAGYGMSVEVSPGVFVPYVVEEVTHEFDANRAASRIVGRRLG